MISKQEQKETIDIISNYKICKDQMRNEIHRVKVDVSAGKIPWWQGETLINEIYDKLLRSDERNKFVQKVAILKVNDEYELFFRQQFNEIFSNP